MPNRAKELAEAHWSYIEDLLTTHNISASHQELVKFHYKSAFIHGYKHGQEDLKDANIQNKPKS